MPEVIRVSISKIIPNPDNVLDKERADVSDLVKSMQSIGYDPAYPAKAIKIGDKYQLITGGRRYLASKKVTGYMYLMQEEIKKDNIKFIEMVRENLLRKNYNPVREAQIFSQMKEKFDYANVQVADMLCISEGHVRHRLKLLEIPKKVQQMILNNELTPRSAEYLSELKDEKVKETLAQEIVEKKLDVNEVQKKVELLKKFSEPDKQLRFIQSKLEHSKPYQEMKREKKEEKSELKIQLDTFESYLYEMREFSDQLVQSYGGFITYFEKVDVNELIKLSKDKKDLKSYVKYFIKNIERLKEMKSHPIFKKLENF